MGTGINQWINNNCTMLHVANKEHPTNNCQIGRLGEDDEPRHILSILNAEYMSDISDDELCR